MSSGTADLDHETACLVSLAHLRGVGPASLLTIHLSVGAEAAWDRVIAGRTAQIRALCPHLEQMNPSGLQDLVDEARTRDPRADLAANRSEGRRTLVLGRDGFPPRLAGDPAPPAVLFSHGDISLLSGPLVAVVGTRNATHAGRALAEAMGADLAAAGVAVVSGLALGIDSSAHRGAMSVRFDPDSESRLGAVAVIGSGLDIAYPRRNADLHRSISAAGLMLSEVPLGVRPVPWRFPARNRIIAGLADALVVVESRAAGGSMLTVNEALQRDVDVLAVPGHPSSPSAAGTNGLLYDGAGPVRDGADVLRAVGVPPPPARRVGGPPPGPTHPGELAVLEAIGPSPSSLAEIVSRSDRCLEDVAAHLVRLEAGGWLVREGQWYEATGSPAGGGGVRR